MSQYLRISLIFIFSPKLQVSFKKKQEIEWFLHILQVLLLIYWANYVENYLFFNIIHQLL